MPLGQLRTKEEILAACKQQVIAATLVCTDQATRDWEKEQDRIENEYRNGAPAGPPKYGYPPSYSQAAINRNKCQEKSPYGCPNPSGYPDAAEEARGRAYCEGCQDQYLKETRDLEDKRRTESDANDRKRLEEIKKCNDKYEQLLSDCINRQGGPIPSSPTTAPIVPVPTSPVRLKLPGEPLAWPRGILDERMEERTRKLWGPIPM
jgi:hypothetical protein